jgi:hypothetical protein
MKMALKKMTLKEIESEAFNYIAENDIDAEIVIDGKITEASKLFADFVHHLWEIDGVYEPSV